MNAPSTHDFQLIAGNLALDFVNTVGNRRGERRDYFRDLTELRRWARLAGLLRGNATLSVNQRQLALIRKVREELHDLFCPSLAPWRSSRALTRLNLRIARVATKRQLRKESGTVSWFWNIQGNDPDLVLAPVLFSAADLLVFGPFKNIRQCQDETCGWLFLDRSRARRRRWCSMTDCGNRAKVRRFYGRRRSKYRK